MKLTENELSIMEVLWSADDALLGSEIIELCKNKKWKASSIHILINSLLSKGAIKIARFEKIGKHYTRAFMPELSKEEYMVQSLDNNVELNDSVIKEMALALIHDKKTSDETIKVLEEMIKEEKVKRGLK